MDVVGRAVLAIEDRDWNRLKVMLHPYIRWTVEDGRAIHGRNRVLARLEAGIWNGPPAHHELRDGRIYRWVEERRSPG